MNCISEGSRMYDTGVFESIAYVHVPDEKSRKLEPKLEKCVLVGYSYE